MSKFFTAIALTVASALTVVVSANAAEISTDAQYGQIQNKAECENVGGTWDGRRCTIN